MGGCDPGWLSHHILLLLSHTEIALTSPPRNGRERVRGRGLEIYVFSAFIHGIIRNTLAAFRGKHYKFYVHTNAYVGENSGIHLSVPVLTKPG